MAAADRALLLWRLGSCGPLGPLISYASGFFLLAVILHAFQNCSASFLISPSPPAPEVWCLDMRKGLFNATLRKWNSLMLCLVHLLPTFRHAL